MKLALDVATAPILRISVVYHLELRVAMTFYREHQFFLNQVCHIMFLYVHATLIVPFSEGGLTMHVGNNRRRF